VKNAFKLITILCLVMLALTCSKDKSEEVAGELRWLRITYEGDSIWWGSDSINITGWKPGEETVYFWDVERGFPDAWIGFYYLWQGEDSIDYSYDDEGFLWVNGKLVAGSYSKLAVLEDSSFIDVVTLEADYYYFIHELAYPNPPLEINTKDLEKFPILSLLEVDIQEWFDRVPRIIDTLNQVPQDIDIYVSYGGSTKKYIRQISGIRNLKKLYIYSRDLANWDLVQLLGAKGLKKLNVKMEKNPCHGVYGFCNFFCPIVISYCPYTRTSLACLTEMMQLVSFILTSSGLGVASGG
jgi:hypothetical protein